MNPASHFLRASLCIAIVAAACLSLHPATAAVPSDRGERATVFDHRYSHNQNYPPRGRIVHELPREAYASRWNRATYYFHAGVWYRPARSHWVVVTPPIGLLVPLLPPFYTTLWIDGVPYYYANGVYYAWRPARGSYVVVEAPAKEASVSPHTSPSDLYVYPKNAQSIDQQATDRYECHRWAVDETGFDPMQPSGGVEPAQAMEKRGAYYRAMTACLEGRGYSVK